MLLCTLLVDHGASSYRKLGGVGGEGGGRLQICTYRSILGRITAVFQLIYVWKLYLSCSNDFYVGVLILEEAGGRVTTIDGTAYSVFDRSLLASNDGLYDKLQPLLEDKHQKLLDKGVEMSPWFIPEGYGVRSGAQLE